MKFYIERVNGKTEEIVTRNDVSEYSESRRDRIEMGMCMNLHPDYYTRIVESETELAEIK